MKPILFALLPTLFIVSVAAQAHGRDRYQTTEPKVGLVLEGGVSGGGDTVATVEFDNGDHQNVRAGEGVNLAIGVHLQPMEGSPWDLRGTVGYKFSSVYARNADIKMTRTVWQLIGSYEFFSGLRVGAGATYHHAVHFDGDGYIDDVSFKNALGPTVEVGWRWIAVTYTDMSYEARYPFSGSLNANSVGVRFAWEF